MRKELLPVASPCMEEWDTMDGDARRRFCQKCATEVVNLSELTGRELARLLRRKPAEELCVRYGFDDDGNVELRADPVLPLIPAALLSRGREVMLGASLAAAALAGCNPAGPAGNTMVAREAIREAAQKLAESGTCTISMEPVLPLEVRLHAAPCVPLPAPAPGAPSPWQVGLGEPSPLPPKPPIPDPAPTPAVPNPPAIPKPKPRPATAPRHQKEPKSEKYPHKTMGKMIRFHDSSFD